MAMQDGESRVKSIAPLVIATLLYFWMAANYWFDLGRPGLAIAFIGYSVANFGFIYDVWGQ